MQLLKEKVGVLALPSEACLRGKDFGVHRSDLEAPNLPDHILLRQDTVAVLVRILKGGLRVPKLLLQLFAQAPARPARFIVKNLRTKRKARKIDGGLPGHLYAFLPQIERHRTQET